MIKSLIIASLAIIFMMLGWVIVQTVWRKVFTGSWFGDDVLIDRRSCSDCSCLIICKNNKNKILN